ncbi:MAG: hypothetical protein AAFX93_14660 [Verrucomicrobiota bacterium]
MFQNCQITFHDAMRSPIRLFIAALLGLAAIPLNAVPITIPGDAADGDPVETALGAPDTVGDALWDVVSDTSRSSGGVYSFQSGDIGNDDVSIMSLEFPAGGDLSFFWKVSSEEAFDFLQVFVNFELSPRFEISGEQDWADITIRLDPGDEVFWVYEKDGSESNGLDTGWVDGISLAPPTLQFDSPVAVFGFEGGTEVSTVAANGNGTVTYSLAGGTGADQSLFGIDTNSGVLSFSIAPAFSPAGDDNGDNVYEVEVFAMDDAETISQVVSVTLTPEGDPIQSALLPFSFEGDADWMVVDDVTRTGGGSYSFQSGAIIDNQASVLTTTVPLSGDLSFFWKVSSERDFDYLQVYVNAERDPRFEISGIQDWAEVSIPVTAGDQIFWVYLKDNAESHNDDTGWVDGITLTPPMLEFDSSTSLFGFEGTTAIDTVVATGNGVITYSLAGGSGQDQAAFGIDPSSGALSFVVGPAFSPAGDFNGDNVYEVEIFADDTINTISETFLVTLVPNDDPLDVALLPFTLGGAADWTLIDDQTRRVGGDYSFQAGAIDNNEFTTISVTAPSNGTLTFYWKVSSEEDFDFLELFVNAEIDPRDEISGDQDWEKVTLTVSAGDEITWVYVKDFRETDNDDTAWIDGIRFFPDGSVRLLTPSFVIAGDGESDVATIEATGPIPANITYAVAGGGGADQALFTIDTNLGELSFIAPPVASPAGDADGDGIYEVEVTADDGSTSDTVLYAIQVFPLGGEGTSAAPFEVDSLDDLLVISENSVLWDQFFLQTADIDASASAALNAGAGFPAIDIFYGEYDGFYYVIDGLTVNQPGLSDAGTLFNRLDGATIRNLVLENLSITAFDNVGGLAGKVFGGSLIEFCSTSGSVTALEDSGEAGGFISSLDEGSLIRQSSSSCDVVGGQYIGGFIAELEDGQAEDCYSSGTVIDSADNVNERVAGFCGRLRSDGAIVRCYSTAVVSSTNANTVAGFVARISQPLTGVTDSFWDTTVSGQATDQAVLGTIGLGTADMQLEATFLAAGWDFTAVWTIDDGLAYPFLQWQNMSRAYLQWVTANGLVIGTNAAPGDSASGDGIANLLKFAFNLDPNVAGASELIVVDIANFTPGLPTTTLITSPFSFSGQFVRLKNFSAAGLSYTVEFSADMITWVASSDTPTVVSDDGGTYEIVEVPRPFFILGGKARFFRLNVVFN